MCAAILACLKKGSLDNKLRSYCEGAGLLVMIGLKQHYASNVTPYAEISNVFEPEAWNILSLVFSPKGSHINIPNLFSPCFSNCAGGWSTASLAYTVFLNHDVRASNDEVPDIHMPCT